MLRRLLDKRLLMLAAASVLLGVLLDLSTRPTARKERLLGAPAPGIGRPAGGPPSFLRPSFNEKAVYRVARQVGGSRQLARLTVYTYFVDGLSRVVAIRGEQLVEGPAHHALDLRLGAPGSKPLVQVASMGPRGLRHGRGRCGSPDRRHGIPCVPNQALPLYLRMALLNRDLPPRVLVSTPGGDDPGRPPRKEKPPRLCHVRAGHGRVSTSSSETARARLVNVTRCDLHGVLTMAARPGLPILSWRGPRVTWSLAERLPLPGRPFGPGRRISR